METNELGEFVLSRLGGAAMDQAESRTMLYVLAQRLLIEDPDSGMTPREIGEEILKLLALPFADQPGYDLAWDPTE